MIRPACPIPIKYQKNHTEDTNQDFRIKVIQILEIILRQMAWNVRYGMTVEESQKQVADAETLQQLLQELKDKQS